jgi:hypothetical protein
MTEKIPRQVILDLLPLYLANEVSEETRGWVEDCLKQDHQLATLAEMAKKSPPLQDIPAPLTKETEMEAFKKSKRLIVQHNVFLGLAVLATFLSAPATISLRDEDPLAPFLFIGLAAIFWTAFFWVNKKLES